jgi:hypothetical protein
MARLLSGHLSQLSSQDFPDGAFREGIEKLNPFGSLERGQTLPAEIQQIVFGNGTGGLQGHKGLHGLTVHGIGDADHPRLQDLGMLMEDVLDFLGVDVLPPG